MTNVELGRLTTRDPKEVWIDEARDFTPWLSENLHLLNAALGLQIELTEREKRVGDFAVDIFGREVGSGAEVVIENQLAPTDHGHLGQLLTYAAGLDAKIVIWISPRFRDEHSQAVDWLNRHTTQETSFFAVELELLQIDNSSPAPHFKVVAEPSEWQKEIASETLQRRTPLELAYHNFFTEVLNRVTSRAQEIKVRSVGYGNWLSFSTGRSGFNVNSSLMKGGNLRTELYVSTGHTARNQRGLSQLSQWKSEIEGALGEEVVFQQMAKDCRIYSQYPTPVDPANPPDDALDWAAERVLKFREIFGPKVKGLELEATEEPSP